MAPPNRIECSVVQFGSDWPGLFLRGDVCLHMANSLEVILNAIIAVRPQPVKTIFPEKVCRGLLSDLKSVEIGKSAPVVQLKHYEDCKEPEIGSTALCDHCSPENGRHRENCPNSAESALEVIRQLVEGNQPMPGRPLAEWVTRACVAFERSEIYPR